jgi:DNA repair protein RadC
MNEQAAGKLLKRAGLAGLADLSRSDLHSSVGLEDFEAHRVLAAIELGRKAAMAGKGATDTVSGPESAFRIFERHLDGAKQEHFCAAFLNTKGGVISVRTIHVGTLNMSLVGPREVFREAVRENAASILVSHNHPSGDPEPSPEDIRLTRRLAEVGDLLDIPLHDHIIIGTDKYVSLKDRGLL